VIDTFALPDGPALAAVLGKMIATALSSSLSH
jgi:hypothetical protein